MAHNIPTFKRIEQLKLQADMVARASQRVCNDWLQQQAKKDGEQVPAPTAEFPSKFYRRLLGLRNGDLN